MANFDSLSTGEKYSASKTLLMRVRAIKSLKPGYAPVDVLRVVANKFYGNSIATVNSMLNFVKTECGEFNSLDELVNLPLDSKAMTYLNDLNAKTQEKQNALAAKQAEMTAKQTELRTAEAKRNGAEKKVQEFQQKSTRRGLLKFMLMVSAVMLGLGLIGSFGGLVGAANGIVGWISNLSFTQTFALGFTGLVGYNIYKQSFKGKFSAWLKKKEEKFQEGGAKLEESLKKEQESVQNLQTELASKQSEVQTALNEHTRAQAEQVSATAQMSGYRATSDLDRHIDAAVNDIQTKYAEIKDDLISNNASDDEKQNLESWYVHYVGSLYVGASAGNFSSFAEVDNIAAEAKQQFENIANPLYIGDVTYNATNVHAGTNHQTNRTVNEMYSSM